MPSDTTNAEQLLRTERERLVRQLAELGAAETGDLNVDIDFGGSFADAAAVTAERTEVLGLVDSLKGQVDDIDRALERIEEGPLPYPYVYSLGPEGRSDSGAGWIFQEEGE